MFLYATCICMALQCSEWHGGVCVAAATFPCTVFENILTPVITAGRSLKTDRACVLRQAEYWETRQAGAGSACSRWLPRILSSKGLDCSLPH